MSDVVGIAPPVDVHAPERWSAGRSRDRSQRGSPPLPAWLRSRRRARHDRRLRSPLGHPRCRLRASRLSSRRPRPARVSRPAARAAAATPRAQLVGRVRRRVVSVGSPSIVAVGTIHRAADAVGRRCRVRKAVGAKHRLRAGFQVKPETTGSLAASRRVQRRTRSCAYRKHAVNPPVGPVSTPTSSGLHRHCVAIARCSTPSAAKRGFVTNCSPKKSCGQWQCSQVSVAGRTR